ncbi:MAG: sigma 54-interacting transcriptional regulator [Bdellovibrionales bacterium]|nr:sigma 54-interacting transcriptional regulator [Bdellovibrionales bacterium]
MLEEKKYCQVGSRDPKRFQGRIIAATNLSLVKLVSEGRFRKDLYYRLCTFQIDMPPLRENKKLIDELIRILIRKYKNESMNVHFSLSKDCRDFFNQYHWPGNIRELKSCLQYLIYSYNNEVRLTQLPKWLESPKETIIYNDLSFHSAKSIFEKKLLISALNKYNGRINYTALKLEISKVTLIAKIKKYDINTSEIKYKSSLSTIGKNEF